MGGTTGLGFSAAEAFVFQGAVVVVVGRDPISCQHAQTNLLGRGISFSGDARNPDTAIQAIALCKKIFGGFDGLYHVAGGSGRQYGDGPLHELSLDGWNSTLELNLTTLMLSNQAAVKAFIDQGVGGTILNMSSVLGYSPSPDHFGTHAYAAAKSAVFGFVKSAAAYYAKYDIRMNVIAPALVETPMSQRASHNEGIMSFIRTKQPLGNGRIGMPDDLNGAAVYFMSDLSAFTTGQMLAVDGGWSISEGQN